MSAQVSERPNGERITQYDQLLGEFFPKQLSQLNPSQLRVGLEHEKIGLLAKDLSPISFDGPQGIETVLRELSKRYGWTPLLENHKIIALKRGTANITLEPGGQLELSGSPFSTLQESYDEITDHLREVQKVSRGLGVIWLSLGCHPFSGRHEIPWMPKQRYRIMRSYMPKRGTRGLDMMLKTSTVQANLDYFSEKDAIEKLRVATAISPIATALFANSPLEGGKATGWLSTRMSIWLGTDPDRSGILPFVFSEDCSFRNYVDWALDTPMYLIYRDGRPVDMTGYTFRQFWQTGHQGHIALIDDWKLHLTTLFPDVRLKSGYIEVRGADMGPALLQVALGAFWKGILFSQETRNEAFSLLDNVSFSERLGLLVDVAKKGLGASLQEKPILPIAKHLLTLAQKGLEQSQENIDFLTPLFEIVDSGKSPAQTVLDRWFGEWNQDPRRLVEATQFVE